MRTKALKEIGGIGPELAEDHSTTLMMNGSGWSGVHAFNAIASGEGPSTISACITQEFQCSRSLMILLLTELPKYWTKLSPKLRMQFLCAQLWYPLFGLMFLLGTILPIIAVYSGEAWVSVIFSDFLLFSIPTAVSIIAVVWYLKHNLWLRPTNVPILSWEIFFFQILRWPWAFYGSLMGIIMVITKRNPGFKVTPKGRLSNSSLSWSILSPYLLLILISALPGIFIQENNQASGYHFFLFFNVISYNILIFLMILQNYNEQRR